MELIFLSPERMGLKVLLHNNFQIMYSYHCQLSILGIINFIFVGLFIKMYIILMMGLKCSHPICVQKREKLNTINTDISQIKSSFHLFNFNSNQYITNMRTFIIVLYNIYNSEIFYRKLRKYIIVFLNRYGTFVKNY